MCYMEMAHTSTSASVLPYHQSVAGFLLNILSRFPEQLFRALQEYLALSFNWVLSIDCGGIQTI